MSVGIRIVTKRICRVDFGETLSLGNFQSIKPALSSSIEYNPQELPDGVTEEQFRNEFKEEVRKEYFSLKQTMMNDFTDFAIQLQKVNVPSKG